MTAELEAFARQLHQWGANVTAIKPGTKRPLHKWQHWQSTGQTEAELLALPWGKVAAVGIVNGSGNFRIFDIDAEKDKDGHPLYPVPRAVLSVVLRAIGLPEDYQWAYASGSGAGWGFIVRCEEELPAHWQPNEKGVFTGLPINELKFHHLELRWNSGQTVITGKHPVGPGYQWVRNEPPFLPPALKPIDQIMQAFESVAVLKQTAVSANGATANSSGVTAYGQAALTDAIRQVSTTLPGNRNNTLFQQTAALVELANGHMLDRGEVERGMKGAALAAGLAENEIEATVASAFKTVGNKARQVDGYEDVEGTAVPDEESSIAFSTFADVDAITGSIEWAWEGWLAKHYLHILASESGVGKSYLAMRIAACFLVRMPWPDGTEFTGETGCILWCEAEAAQQLNKERAKMLQLPLEKIIIPNIDPLHDIDFRNNKDKDAVWALALGSEIRFIVVDSLSGADPRDENSSDKLGVLKWWAELARNSGKPILMTHHLNKPLFGNEAVTLNRLRGSSSITQLARIIWAIDTPDLNQKDKKRLIVLKNNLATFPEPIGISIGKNVEFGPAPSAPVTYSELDRAIDFLRDLLQREPLPAKEVNEQADEAGIAESTLKRAKSKLGVTSIKLPNSWVWSLPVNKGISDGLLEPLEPLEPLDEGA